MFWRNNKANKNLNKIKITKTVKEKLSKKIKEYKEFSVYSFRLSMSNLLPKKFLIRPVNFMVFDKHL